ncbi:NUDIX hydrolase [Planococcus halocryophilus]|uniref:NUDIX hydrolase n=1 Tax=Planococcus halocryophilus TaxID=1215089 RepID=UPI001F11320B|nr:NUDIX domain-containing protein [Planococcus halocryophilus]MCH4825195.1 NUDIX domain-containing protein [Planococcus halocryophilus]
MTRDRASVLLIKNNKIGLIKRVKEEAVYYVFPGGGIEEGETPEIAAKREALEEVGVEVKIHECLAKVKFNGIQYFFLAEIIQGTFGAGKGEEYTDEQRNRGTYLPIWIEIENLNSINVKPKELVIKIQSLLNQKHS